MTERYTRLMFMNGTWRVFLAGVLCGIIFMAVVGAASLWWKPGMSALPDDLVPVRSENDAAIYDQCLMGAGNTVACDALMRVLARERAMKKEAAKMLAAGISKRDVMQWGIKQGYVCSQMRDALGLSHKDFVDDNNVC